MLPMIQARTVAADKRPDIIACRHAGLSDFTAWSIAPRDESSRNSEPGVADRKSRRGRGIFAETIVCTRPGRSHQRWTLYRSEPSNAESSATWRTLRGETEREERRRSRGAKSDDFGQSKRLIKRANSKREMPASYLVLLSPLAPAFPIPVDL